MERIVKEYNQWLKDNQSMILHLREHDSPLYTRLSPVYEVLNYLAEESEENGLILDQDLYKIFQIGLEYLHQQLETCKLYLENIFKQDFHAFLAYDQVVGYLLYLEDLKYEMVENKVKYDRQAFNRLMEKLEQLMNERDDIPDNLNLYVDSEVHRIVDVSDWQFKGINDIFVDIAETLGVELYIENDFIIGKDI